MYVPVSSLLRSQYTLTEDQVPDAVLCINELARRRGTSCTANVVTHFVLIGRAEIVGVVGGGGGDITTSDW